jgi:hypothetical protein
MKHNTGQSRRMNTAALAVGAFLLAARPAAAQFATNTPAAPAETPVSASTALPAFAATNTPPIAAAPLAPAFAVNTPPPSPTAVLPTAVPAQPAVPDAPVSQYAARLWTEAALIDVLIGLATTAQAERGESGSALADDTADALALTAAELERRFPGAPRTPADRARLLDALLALMPAPLDLRVLAARHTADVLDRAQPQTDRFEAEGWLFQLTPLALGTGETWLVNAAWQPPRAETAAFDGYFAFTRDAAGWQPIEAAPLLPAAPFPAARVALERIGDLTGDSADEIAFSIETDSAINRELRIYGVRGARLEDLVLPGETIRFNAITEWAPGRVVVSEAELRAPLWGCLAERAVEWAYALNQFRPGLPGPFAPQETLACQLHRFDPLFARSPADAIGIISAALGASARDEGSADRAEMVLAMLYTLNGETERATAEVARLRARAEAAGDGWLQAQTAAYQAAAARIEATPLTICYAVSRLGPDAACDFAAVFTRAVAAAPPPLDRPLAESLSALGVPAFTRTTLSEVGRLPREEVAFIDDTAGRRWIFAPTGDGVYVLDAAAVPASPALPAPRPAAGVVSALLGQDPAAALGLLDAWARDAGQTAQIAFLRAYAYDMLNERTVARDLYYAAWQAQPGTLWGTLAAAHLERR